MAGLLSAFARRFGRDRPEPEAHGRLKTLAREALALSDDVALAANEIVCADPACPGLETVILVMAPGRRTRALKIGKPLAEVTPQDIRAAAAEPG
ncbi:hypothetical protein [Salinarimonas sp.]|uniref:hypothetical protein n=1 Tax=Salinarimonas sp. TaxID=2766526 RepID=UPI0032D8F074